MQVKKSLIAAMAVVALGAGALGANAVLAAEESRPVGSLVTAIAEKFNLDAAEVQAVFDEHHAAMRAEHEAKAAERLAQAVEDGKLTQEQADALSAKVQENKAFFESLKGMTKEERQEAMHAHRDEMKAWAEEHGMTPPFFHEYRGHGRGGDDMMRMPMHHNMMQ